MPIIGASSLEWSLISRPTSAMNHSVRQSRHSCKSRDLNPPWISSNWFIRVATRCWSMSCLCFGSVLIFPLKNWVLIATSCREFWSMWSREWTILKCWQSWVWLRSFCHALLRNQRGSCTWKWCLQLASSSLTPTSKNHSKSQDHLKQISSLISRCLTSTRWIWDWREIRRLGIRRRAGDPLRLMMAVWCNRIII